MRSFEADGNEERAVTQIPERLDRMVRGDAIRERRNRPVDSRESKTHPEVLAVKNMTEDQEINYVYERLMREIQPDNEK
jgi:hypothetical protein